MIPFIVVSHDFINVKTLMISDSFYKHYLLASFSFLEAETIKVSGQIRIGNIGCSKTLNY